MTFTNTVTTSSKDNRNVKLEEWGYKAHPLAFAYHFHDNKVTRATRLNPYTKLYPNKRQMDTTEEALLAQLLLTNEKLYNHGMRDEFEEGDCIAQHAWQLMSYPTCNTIHETDLFDTSQYISSNIKLINNGYWRDVWSIQSKQLPLVLKTLRYHHDFEDRNYDRHRRDALAMEHLTSSKHVVDIYSHCANSGVFEYSSNGDIESLIWPYDGSKSPLTNMDRLRIAMHVSMGITDLHTIDHDEYASIAHTDITPGQFIMIDGMFKLNDFNRCRFLRKNKITEDLCGYEVGNNPGTFRSPEEYNYKMQTEKVDVYSMGNIFYSLLTEEWPYEDMKEKKAINLLKVGIPPPIGIKLQESSDPIVRIMLKAIRMCWINNPGKRATAKEVEEYLTNQLTILQEKAEIETSEPLS